MEARKSFLVFLCTLLASAPASAAEVFKWVDDEGIPHFSDQMPAAQNTKVSRIVLAANNPANYDPLEDQYSIRNQAARTSKAYKKVEEKREERAADRAEAAERATQYEQQFIRYYDEPIRSYYYPSLLNRPPYTRPGHYPPYHGGKPHHRPRPRHHRRYDRPEHRPTVPGPTRPAMPTPGQTTTVRNQSVHWAPSMQRH